MEDLSKMSADELLEKMAEYTLDLQEALDNRRRYGKFSEDPQWYGDKIELIKQEIKRRCNEIL